MKEAARKSLKRCGEKQQQLEWLLGLALIPRPFPRHHTDMRQRNGKEKGRENCEKATAKMKKTGQRPTQRCSAIYEKVKRESLEWLKFRIYIKMPSFSRIIEYSQLRKWRFYLSRHFLCSYTNQNVENSCALFRREAQAIHIFVCIPILCT